MSLQIPIPTSPKELINQSAATIKDLITDRNKQIIAEVSEILIKHGMQQSGLQCIYETIEAILNKHNKIIVTETTQQMESYHIKQMQQLDNIHKILTTLVVQQNKLNSHQRRTHSRSVNSFDQKATKGSCCSIQ